MRRNYISPEFIKKKVFGTFNMLEESNFFSSKMLQIDDLISIKNEDIIWYQRENSEQIDFNIESSMDSYVYSSSLTKQKNHSLKIADNQSDFQLNKNTKWELSIRLKSILLEHIFVNLKRWRTFEGVKNEYLIEKDIDIAIRKYIENNILPKYNFIKIDFFIKYRDLREFNLLKFDNYWNNNLTNDFIFNKIETNTDFNEESIKVIFEQIKPSSDYNFEYYYNIFFKKR